MTRSLRIGFLPLVDAALLVVAARLGFAEEEGLTLDLVREVSWANIRDRLVLGHLDAAHLLAPAAVAATLGLGHRREALIAPAVLSLNGNAITLSPALHDEIVARTGEGATPQATAAALAAIVAGRADRPFTFAHVFPFSTHHYTLRLWLTHGGLDPDRDVRLVVLPPPTMADALRRGDIDGFCVGAPWSSMAVATGSGVILHFGTDLVPEAPEKVLALRAGFDAAEPGVVEALCRSLGRAARWAAAPGTIEPLSRLMADPGVLDVEPGVVRDILSGQILVESPSRRRSDPGHIRLTPDVLVPDPAHAEWIYRRMVEARQVPFDEGLLVTARSAYRPDRWLAAQAAAAAAT